jgi:hypothetical protein
MTMNYHFRITLDAAQSQQRSLADWRVHWPQHCAQNFPVRFDDERLDDRTTRYEHEN